MLELWARQVASMSAWQMVAVIAIAINLVLQVIKLQGMEVSENA